MSNMRMRILLSLMMGAVAWSIILAQQTDPVMLDADILSQLHKQIRPQPGESRWLELPWQIELHAARQKAAAEGKPLFVLSGGGATGIGAC
jgi:hypothetical protein